MKPRPCSSSVLTALCSTLSGACPAAACPLAPPTTHPCRHAGCMRTRSHATQLCSSIVLCSAGPASCPHAIKQHVPTPGSTPFHPGSRDLRELLADFSDSGSEPDWDADTATLGVVRARTATAAGAGDGGPDEGGGRGAGQGQMTPATLERRMVEPLLLDTIRAMRAEQQQGRFRKVPLNTPYPVMPVMARGSWF